MNCLVYNDFSLGNIDCLVKYVTMQCQNYILHLFLLLLGLYFQTCFSSIYIKIQDNAQFFILVNDQIWINGSDIYFTCSNQKYSLSNGKLYIVSVDNDKGEDKSGKWMRKTFTLAAKQKKHSNGINDCQKSIVVFVQSYDQLNILIFGQYFPEEIRGTSVNEAEDVMTGFPVFSISKNKIDCGYLAFGGMMYGDKRKAFGRWHYDTKNIVSGLESGPLVLFDRNNSALIMSSFINPMSGSTMYTYNTEIESTLVTWGLIGSAENIPKGFMYSSVLHYSYNGINDAFKGWGKFLRRYFNKDSSYSTTDLVNNYLGYWTASGAYYYYKTENGKNYEDTVLDIHRYAKMKNIPYRYIEYDSWWYYKGPDGGVTNWTARADIFPHGLKYIWEKTGWPVIAHNRWWSSATPYAKQNGGKYSFILEKNTTRHALPNDTRFWKDLFAQAKEWGMISYEQDWMNLQFDLTHATRTSLSLGGLWLEQMGAAAGQCGVTIQYCMAPPRTALQALQIPAVTQARVSDDYKPGNNEWRIGVTSLFAHHTGVTPFKDNFWTSQRQPGNPYDLWEPFPGLESLVSTLSTGLVAPGDMIGAENISLIMKSCNSDGLILKPDQPALAIDKQIIMKAWTNFSGEVWTTYSQIAGWRFGIVFGAAFTSTDSIQVTPRDVYKTDMDRENRIFSLYDHENINVFNDKNPVILTNCSLSEFCLFYTTPVINFRGKELLLLGELEKWVVMSSKRFTNIEVSLRDVIVYVKGGIGENMTFSYKYDQTIITVICDLSHTGTAIISIANQSCISS